MVVMDGNDFVFCFYMINSGHIHAASSNAKGVLIESLKSFYLTGVFLDSLMFLD